MLKESNDDGDIDLGGLNLGFGAWIIERTESVQEDIEHEGAQGMISLIGAAIARYRYNHQQLLRFGRRICPPGYFGTFREFIDRFCGDDRRRCLWKRQDDGSYALLA
ncbi:MAG TPA: hypothetical protein VJM34_04255 [Novosphingobium sp.]|nr:hypothetical protein [Novosphingobium sp.]